MPTDTTVKFTADDVLAIAGQLGSLAAMAFPPAAAAITLVEGAASLVRNTILPAIQHLQPHEISVVEQAAEALESEANRLRVGAPPSPGN